jgi:hypothetical protein
MNKDEILDDSIFEEVNGDIQAEESDTTEDLDETALLEELDLSTDGEEELITEDVILENLDDTIDLPTSEGIDDTIEESVQNEFSVSEDESDITTEEELALMLDETEIAEKIIEDDSEESFVAEETEVPVILEEDLPENEDTEEVLSQSEDLDEDVVEEIQEEIEDFTETEESLEIDSDINLITNDLNNIQIEFGIEAKGFILSVKMMEAMIEKGYIIKDILNDKIFDAVMIFNGNLENTVMTSDIKIKIEDGKIQLIKG